MYHRNRWLVLILIMAGLLLPACQQTPKAATKVEPAKIEKIEGSEFKKVILTSKAAERLGIETVQVKDAGASGSQRLVVPYAAVLYGLKGETWAYTNPEPLVFVRQPVTVYSIKDDQAVLVQGPPIGTAVVTVGGIELYGAETGVSK